ncbi:MAG: response regulator [Paracoccaceae bacterium]
MPEMDPFSPHRYPTPTRPLLGLTVLVVEDSRFSCEAMRLLCLRSGARIRRADCLRSARRHLQVYRPSVVIIDLGLPDGSGAELIDELNRTVPRVSVILGTSGDDMAESMSMAAGADGFLAKPVHSLAAFQETILQNLPADSQPTGPRPLNDEEIVPDQVAYRDDMAHVADVLGEDLNELTLDYVAQFVTGVAKSAGDAELVAAGRALAESRSDKSPSRSHLARIAGMVQERINDRIAI